MKVKITYTEQEKQQADKLAAIIKNELKTVRIKSSNKYKPYYHIYLNNINDRSTT